MRGTKKLAALGALSAVGTPIPIALADTPADGASAAPTPVAPIHARLAGEPTLRAQMREHQHERLMRTHARLLRRAGEKRKPGTRLWSNGRLREDNQRLRAALKAPATSTATGGGGAGGQLAAIRACESGGNYSTNTGNGFYGAYQFTQESWQAVGGSGNPAAASPAEQDKRAAMLMAQSGAGNWPVCGS